MQFKLLEEELYNDINLDESSLGEINFTTREFEQILKYNGYTFSRASGDHNIYTKPGCNHISVMTGKKTPNKMVLRRLIKENDLKIPDKLQRR